MAESNFVIYFDENIREQFSTFDSELIQEALKNGDKYISVDHKYRDVFEIIRRNEFIDIQPENLQNTEHLYLGLLYFKNKRILKNLKLNILKHVKNKYYSTFPPAFINNLVYSSQNSKKEEMKAIREWLRENKLFDIDHLLSDD